MSELPPALLRELQTRSGENLCVFVDWPSPSPKREDEFICTFGIKTSRKTAKGEAYGIDGLQALYAGLRSLQALIVKFNAERSEEDKIFWVGGMDADDLGLPSYDRG